MDLHESIGSEKLDQGNQPQSARMRLGQAISSIAQIYQDDRLTDDEYFTFDAEQDTQFSHAFPEFARILHVFQMEWYGIRSASGSLAGHKLAITASKPFPHGYLSRIGENIDRLGVDKIVFHGLGINTRALLDFLSERNGPDTCFLVYHGNLAQWIGDEERGMAMDVLRLAHDGRLKRLHFMRAGNHLLLPDKCFAPLLLNAPPRTGMKMARSSKAFSTSNNKAIIPGWDNYRKNFYTNLVAAELSERLSEVLVYAEPRLTGWLRPQKSRQIGYSHLASHLEILAKVDLCLNVTMIDCHPMVDLEALAVGTPSLCGPLFLDALQDHPYTKLVTVDNPLSISAIIEGIDLIADCPPDERDEIMADYQANLIKISRQRYAEFLEL